MTMSELFTQSEIDSMMDKAVDFLMECLKRQNFRTARPGEDNIIFLMKKDCVWQGINDPAELVISFIALDKNGNIPEKNFLGHISSPFCDIAFSTIDFAHLQKKLDKCLKPAL